jgi:hypothetical protein
MGNCSREKQACNTFVSVANVSSTKFGPISDHYFHTRFATWSSIFMMHVKAWDQHQYQQLGTRFHAHLLYFFCRYASVVGIRIFHINFCLVPHHTDLWKSLSVMFPARFFCDLFPG